MSAFRFDSEMIAIGNPVHRRCEAPLNTQANHPIRLRAEWTRLARTTHRGTRNHGKNADVRVMYVR